MNEFLEMIFRSYANSSDSKSYFGDDTDKLLDELEKIKFIKSKEDVLVWFQSLCIWAAGIVGLSLKSL